MFTTRTLLFLTLSCLSTHVIIASSGFPSESAELSIMRSVMPITYVDNPLLMGNFDITTSSGMHVSKAESILSLGRRTYQCITSTQGGISLELVSGCTNASEEISSYLPISSFIDKKSSQLAKIRGAIQVNFNGIKISSIPGSIRMGNQEYAVAAGIVLMEYERGNPLGKIINTSWEEFFPTALAEISSKKPFTVPFRPRMTETTAAFSALKLEIAEEVTAEKYPSVVSERSSGAQSRVKKETLREYKARRENTRAKAEKQERYLEQLKRDAVKLGVDYGSDDDVDTLKSRIHDEKEERSRAAEKQSSEKAEKEERSRAMAEKQKLYLEQSKRDTELRRVAQLKRDEERQLEQLEEAAWQRSAAQRCAEIHRRYSCALEGCVPAQTRRILEARRDAEKAEALLSPAARLRASQRVSSSYAGHGVSGSD